MYGIGLSFSPPESPSTADEYATYITSSLKKWGAERQNPLAIGRLRNLSLGGRGWIIILDFPEVSMGLSLLLPILIKYSIQAWR
jgi:hypothetical protein